MSDDRPMITAWRKDFSEAKKHQRVLLIGRTTRHTYDAQAASALVIGYWQADENAFFAADLPGFVPPYTIEPDYWAEMPETPADVKIEVSDRQRGQ